MRRWKPARRTLGTGLGEPSTLLVNWADWQLGKALRDDISVLTTGGWKSHGQLVAGDMVYGPNGTPVKVLATSGSTLQEMFAVEFDKDVVIHAAGPHEWTGYRRHKINGALTVIMGTVETRDLIQRQYGERTKGQPNPFFIDVIGVDFPERELLVDPYVLGVWLGDGSRASNTIASSHEDMDETRHNIESRGYTTTSRTTDQTFGILDLYSALQRLGVTSIKHIPEDYLNASSEQRLELLRGLMDTDGSASPQGCCEFSQSNELMADEFAFLLSSLGIKYKRTLKKTTHKDSHRFQFTPSMQVFCMKRKADRLCLGRKDQTRYRYVRSVKASGQALAQCIQVEGGLYLAGRELVLTHNSEGGGVAATVERIERSFEATQRRLRELRRIGRNVEGITIANMGDPVEGCMGNYASQLFTVELNQREQIELSLDLWTAGARLLLPLADRASFVSVTCNHGELGRGGSNRNQTSESDNIGGLLPGLLRRVLGDHEAFADVSWHIPHDEPVTTADLSGVPVAFTHGHKGGSSFEKWIDDQSRELVYRRKFTPRLWIAAHRHHLRMADLGPYTLAQCPSLDGGSQWLTNLNGRWSTPGTLTMLVGQHDVRGYSDVAVI